ncbi:MAG TPA: hypothetical protein VKB23_09400 [Solirubrobacterales bacterium]|nr:hypothetical protein [Solirubrobacterales bacterium]
MILFVSLQLRRPEAEHPELCFHLESADGGALRLRESIWLLDTVEQPRWWHVKLSRRADAGDQILIARLARSWAPPEEGAAREWLVDRARRW